MGEAGVPLSTVDTTEIQKGFGRNNSRDANFLLALGTPRRSGLRSSQPQLIDSANNLAIIIEIARWGDREGVPRVDPKRVVTPRNQNFQSILGFCRFSFDIRYKPFGTFLGTIIEVI